MVIAYHVRFLVFAPYADVEGQHTLLKVFYFGSGLGHEAFALYILTSGMLLGGLSCTRWNLPSIHIGRDVLRRALRFYVLLLPALLLGGVFDLIGYCVFRQTGVYAYFEHFSADFSIETVARNLVPMQGFVISGLGSNAMLHLLAYECWAFAALAVFFLLNRSLAGALALAMVAIAGTLLEPTFFGYLVIWMFGMALVRRNARTPLRPPLLLSGLALVVSLMLSRAGGSYLADAPAQWALLGRLLLDLQFAAGAAMFLLALGRRRGGPAPAWQTLSWRMHRLYPGAAFTVFAGHMPLMMLAVAAASHVLALPVAGQPDALAFLLFAVITCILYLYGFLLSMLGVHALRLFARLGGKQWPRYSERTG
jgi:hypothetical protein